MADLPLVSMVTPSYNQGSFLRRAIDSILTQNYPRLEYIVIDGGSTDDSVEILKSYGERITWVSEPDNGQTHALNKGFARAHGEVLGFLCADDLLLPGAIARAVKHLQAHPDWDLVYGNAHFIDEKDGIEGIYPSEPFQLDRLRECCFICQPAAFWRAELARKVGPFNEALDCGMDYEYWFRMHRAGGKLVYVDDFLAQSRNHNLSKTEVLRLKVYQRNIQICLEQSGFAELNHFARLWRYRCWERPQGWPGRLRWLPLFSPTMAFAHYLWANGRPRNFLNIMRGIGRGVKRLWNRALCTPHGRNG